MTGQANAQATARSPLEFVACSSCHAPHDAPTLPFFLTDCAHTLCQTCTANATAAAQGEGAQPPPKVIACPACGHAGPVVRLDLASSLEHCFRPLQDLITELGMAAEWQLVNLVDQLAYFRQKCADQKLMLAKAATELKKMRDLKDRVAELSRQNEALQQQLDAAPPAPPPGRSLAQFAAANDQNVPPAYGQRPAPPPTQSRGQKRPRGHSPERHAFFEIPPASRSPSVSSASLALAPGRLSLTPAQQKQTAARLSAQSSMQNRGPPLPASSSSTSVPVDGRASRQGGPAPRNAAEESSKDRLARFAYNPSRASNRSAAGTPVLPPPQPQDHFAPPAARASTAQGESPFYYNVPLTTGAQEYETQQQQQQHRYGYLASDSFASVHDDDGFGGGRPAYDDRQGDRQLMPPPPLPSSRRQPQQHFVASNASYNTPATHLGGGTAQPQQYFPGAQQTPATRGPGMISRPASTSLPPRASSTSTMTSHRQPFRPASVAAGAAGPPSGQSSARFGRGVRTGSGC